MNWLFMNKPKRPNRVSVDVDDLHDRIQSFSPDPFWKKSSLAQKVRHILEEAFGISSEKRLLGDFLRDLAYGHVLDRYTSGAIAQILGLPTDVIESVKKIAVQEPLEEFDSLASLCLHFWGRLQANSRINKTELEQIVDGKRASEITLLRIANTIAYPEEYLEQLNQGATNGHAHNNHQ